MVSMASPIRPDSTSFWISVGQPFHHHSLRFLPRAPQQRPLLEERCCARRTDSLCLFLMEASSSCTACSVDLANASAVAQ